MRSSSARINMNLDALQKSWVRVVLLVSLGLALVAASLASPAQPSAAQTTGPGQAFTQMGMHIPQAKDGVWPDVPIGSIRLWDTGVSWREINTAAGVYDWSTLDRVVALANSKGAAVLYVFGNTPAWAAEPSCLAAQGGAIKGAGANCPPADLSSFATFAGEVAKRYGTRIESYELWNEGNIGTFWRGSVKQLFDMTTEGAKAIKRANPQALIASVSVTTRLDTSLYKFLPEYANYLASANWPIDAFAIHSYPAGRFAPCSWSGDDFFVACSTPLAESGAAGGWQSAMRHLWERERHLVDFSTALYQQHNMPRSKQLWDTELNYGLAGPGEVGAQQFSESEQVTLINYSYLQSSKRTVARTYWFAWGPKDLEGVVQFGVTTDFGTKTAQAFGNYWNWAQLGLIQPGGNSTFVMDPNKRAYASVQYLYPGNLPRGEWISYISVKPTLVEVVSNRDRWRWSAVGSCTKVPARTPISAEALSVAPYLQAQVPIPGC